MAAGRELCAETGGAQAVGAEASADASSVIVSQVRPGGQAPPSISLSTNPGRLEARAIGSTTSRIVNGSGMATAGTTCNLIDFEGIADEAPIGTIAGTPNVTFEASWLGLIDVDAGGGGNFANEPTPDTIAYFLTPADAINFDSGVQFVELFYTASAISLPVTLTAWDGLSGTGSVVDTAIGATVGTDFDGAPCVGDPSGQFCLWDTIQLTAPSDTILSITLAGAVANQFGFDSMTFCTGVGTGACCDDDTGGCAEALSQTVCEVGGGRFGGIGSTCATINPPCTSAPARIFLSGPPRCAAGAKADLVCVTGLDCQDVAPCHIMVASDGVCNADPDSTTPGSNQMIAAAPGQRITLEAFVEISAPGDIVKGVEVGLPCSANFSGGGTLDLVDDPLIDESTPLYVYLGAGTFPATQSCTPPYLPANIGRLVTTDNPFAMPPPPVVSAARYAGEFTFVVSAGASGTTKLAVPNEPGSLLRDESDLPIPFTTDGVLVKIAGACCMGASSCVDFQSSAECAVLGGTFLGNGTYCDIRDCNLNGMVDNCEGPAASCHGDVNNDGFINQVDRLKVANCIQCTDNDPDCDVNCDGVVNYEDFGDVECLQFNSADQCCGLPHGACLDTSLNHRCILVPEDFCNLISGDYLGDGVTCPPIDGDCNANCVGDGCEPLECTTNAQCDDGNFCTCDRCFCGVCFHQSINFGDPNCDCSLPDLDDILSVLADFSNGAMITEPGNNLPLLPPCILDGVIDLVDILAILNAFSGINPCTNICMSNCTRGACCDGTSCLEKSTVKCFEDGGNYKGDTTACPPNVPENPCP